MKLKFTNLFTLLLIGVIALAAAGSVLAAPSNDPGKSDHTGDTPPYGYGLDDDFPITFGQLRKDNPVIIVVQNANGEFVYDAANNRWIWGWKLPGNDGNFPNGLADNFVFWTADDESWPSDEELADMLAQTNVETPSNGDENRAETSTAYKLHTDKDGVTTCTPIQMPTTANLGNENKLNGVSWTCPEDGVLETSVSAVSTTGESSDLNLTPAYTPASLAATSGLENASASDFTPHALYLQALENGSEDVSVSDFTPAAQAGTPALNAITQIIVVNNGGQEHTISSNSSAIGDSQVVVGDGEVPVTETKCYNNQGHEVSCNSSHGD